MNFQDHISPGALLFLRYGLAIRDSVPIIENWLEEHPQESSQTLSELIESGKIFVKQQRLVELPRLSPQEARSLALEIQQSNELEIKNRWYHLKYYRQCFIGSELVDWFVNNNKMLLNNSKILTEEAIALGQSLLDHQLIHHVTYEHDFENEFLFYRFTK